MISTVDLLWPQVSTIMPGPKPERGGFGVKGRSWIGVGLGTPASQRAPPPTGLRSDEGATKEGGGSRGARRRAGQAERPEASRDSRAFALAAGVDLGCLTD